MKPRDVIDRMIELIELQTVLEAAAEAARQAGFPDLAAQCDAGLGQVADAMRPVDAVLHAESGALVTWTDPTGTVHTGTLRSAYVGCRARVDLDDGRKCYVSQELLRPVSA